MKKNGVICIDVGGTKISGSLFESPLSLSHPEPIKTMTHKTFKGRKGLKASLTAMIDPLIEIALANEIEVHSTLGLSFPGKHNHYLIEPGTANNLALTDGDMDYCDVRSLVQHPVFNKIEIENDAFCQLLGQMICSPREERTLTGYIGPGTGLGGGFAEISNGKLSKISDGHIFDILLQTTTGIEEAEEYLSGRGIKRLFNKEAKELSEADIKLNEHKVSELTEMIIQLIRKLKSGEFNKSKRKNEWSESIKNKIKNTQHFYFGGSIGTKGPLHKAMIKKITRKLKNSSLTQDIKITAIKKPELKAQLYLAQKIIG